MLDKNKIDLNAPAFGQGAQTLESLSAEPASVEVMPEVKEEVVETMENEPSVEENKVPYSRFKKFHDEALQARQEAEEWRAKAESFERRNAPTEDNEMPSYWVDLYGDSEASQKAWKIQQRREEEIERRAYEAGQRGAIEMEQKEIERVESNVDMIDENFDELSDYVGRSLTEKEQSAILDIVDEYTAKDRNGNYLGAIMPFDKAWEIYEMKNKSSRTSQRRERDSVAAIAGTSTQGNTTDVQAEKDRNWNPLARGSWRSRLQN